MTPFRASWFLAGLLTFLAGPLDLPAATNEAPDFKEIYELIRAHAAGVTDAELNRAAVQGLLKALDPKASLVTAGPSTNQPVEGPLVSRAVLFDGDIAYLRIARVDDGLAKEVAASCQQFNSTNKLKGVVLDLRYADGSDYAAAVAVADLFAATAEPLLNWGAGMVSSHEKTNAIRVPVAVLANRRTGRAAEALAALLRSTGAGLILGGRSAGQAMVTQEFPLKNGAQLRVAIAPVVLGDGSPFPVQGVQPDIEVAVGPEEDRAYYADSFLVSPKAGLFPGTKSATNGTSEASLSSRRSRMNEAELVREHRRGTNEAANPGGRSRINEADLVREHKEGMDIDNETDAGAMPLRQSEPSIPAVNDPTLARGLDLLKGLAIVRRDHF